MNNILVTGYTGLVGSAIYRELKHQDYPVTGFDSTHCDLRHSGLVDSIFSEVKPDVIFHCAAHAGGIKEAIDHPADMLTDNMAITANVFRYSYKWNVKKLINFASSCIYPVNGKQPYTESLIGTGKTDENWAYAISKIAGVELCKAYNRQYGSNFISLVPCNVYGFNDNFHPDKSHVIPALIRKFHEAKEKGELYVSIWGGGESLREFIFSDDLAKIAVDVMENVDCDDIDGVMNVGIGGDIRIYKLAELIRHIVHPNAVILRDIDKPSGVYKKMLDISKMKKLGYGADTPLKEGIRRVYNEYQAGAYCQSI